MLSREIRELEHVPRWGIARVIKRQSVAEHSYFTAMYANELAYLIGWGPEEVVDWHSLIMYALWHDSEEAFMSDIPGPIKHLVVDNVEYTEFAKKQSLKNWGIDKSFFIEDLHHEVLHEVKQIVKCASTMDEVFYLLGEQQMGNGTLDGLIKLSISKLDAEIKKLPFKNEEHADETMNTIQKLLRNHSNGYSNNDFSMES
jgi:5'-deoxynucleotidase YfbR-like HD superfamily hydrolase